MSRGRAWMRAHFPAKREARRSDGHARCPRCGRWFPEHLIAPWECAEGRWELCALCALTLRNKYHGCEKGTPFGEARPLPGRYAIVLQPAPIARQMWEEAKAFIAAGGGSRPTPITKEEPQ